MFSCFWNSMYMYLQVKKKYYVHKVLRVDLRFGIGSARCVAGAVALPLQFPLTSLHTPFTTLRACVFLMKSQALGFSFTAPLWRCCPKNFSIGSWQSLLLKNSFTPGIVKTNSTISTNDLTVEKNVWIIHLCTCMHRHTLAMQKQYKYFVSDTHVHGKIIIVPVILIPNRVSGLNIIIRFCCLLLPSLARTLASHSSR